MNLNETIDCRCCQKLNVLSVGRLLFSLVRYCCCCCWLNHRPTKHLKSIEIHSKDDFSMTKNQLVIIVLVPSAKSALFQSLHVPPSSLLLFSFSYPMFIIFFCALLLSYTMSKVTETFVCCFIYADLITSSFYRSWALFSLRSTDRRQQHDQLQRRFHVSQCIYGEMECKYSTRKRKVEFCSRAPVAVVLCETLECFIKSL